jgi:hypothetical protein
VMFADGDDSLAHRTVGDDVLCLRESTPAHALTHG